MRIHTKLVMAGSQLQIKYKSEDCYYYYYDDIYFYLPGSVRQKAATCSPEDSLGRYFFFCASFPAIRIPCKIRQVVSTSKLTFSHTHIHTHLESNGLMCSQCDSDGAVQGGDLCQSCVDGVGQPQTTCQEIQTSGFNLSAIDSPAPFIMEPTRGVSCKKSEKPKGAASSQQSHHTPLEP